MSPLGRIGCVVAVVTLVGHPGGGWAGSRRKACRQSCGAAIDACIAEGGKRGRCRRQTLKQCRREGLAACTPTTTTPGATTTSTTTIAATTTTGAGSTTTTPGSTTTTTTVVSVHGCTLATAVDLTAAQSDRTVTFAPYAYTPACVRVLAGQSVTFSGSFSFHPLVGGEIVAGTKMPDQASPIQATNTGTMSVVTFPSTGLFPYYCDNHGVSQSMVGAVFVDP